MSIKWKPIRDLSGYNGVLRAFRYDKGIYASDDGRFVAGAVGQPNGWGGEKQDWELKDRQTGKYLGSRDSLKKIKTLAQSRVDNAGETSQ